MLQDDASLLPEALQMALAAQAYAKSELLWYFRHVAEALPAAPSAAGSGGSKLGLPLLSEKPIGPQLSEDAHVVTLVAATTAVYDLLVRTHFWQWGTAYQTAHAFACSVHTPGCCVLCMTCW
jgi:hypothetical protein